MMLWLITGSAGFIGSHLLETLLLCTDQEVVSLDNFATGHRRNLDEIRFIVGDKVWRRHYFLEADIADLSACREACNGVDIVLHQAALGSVPRSIDDPLSTHAANVTGFLNMLIAARDAKVRTFVYAASSSTYGDHPVLPKIEHITGCLLSPYAVTKYIDELYAEVFSRCYGTATIGLRYFNVFGTRQNSEGLYAAVIPRWITAMLRGEPVIINGDGDVTRDFSYVANIVQANLLAGTITKPEALNQIYNIAFGGQMSLNTLYDTLKQLIHRRHPKLIFPKPLHQEVRFGDIKHSQADISKARRLLKYTPTYDIFSGLVKTLPWYESRISITPSGKD